MESAGHVIGHHVCRGLWVQSALGDVTSTIHQSLRPGHGLGPRPGPGAGLGRSVSNGRKAGRVTSISCRYGR